MRDVIGQVLREFCCGFVRDPYLCYTEHGQHALFFTTLLSAIPEPERYATWSGEKVCVVQKEYPTAANLGKPQRQHWDVAVLKLPLASKLKGARAYDFFRLEAAIEFGMNERREHLADDIQRLSHPDSNVEYGFLVHLYRLSERTSLFSGRDWSPTSARIITKEEIAALVQGKPVEVFYAMCDRTGSHENGVWVIDSDRGNTELACA